MRTPEEIARELKDDIGLHRGECDVSNNLFIEYAAARIRGAVDEALEEAIDWFNGWACMKCGHVQKDSYDSDCDLCRSDDLTVLRKSEVIARVKALKSKKVKA